MKVLFLGPTDSPLIDFLRSTGDEVVARFERVTQAWLDEHPCEFLVSYGYQHILPKTVLDRFPDRAINLHVALLPWNRGSDPNFWSIVEDTPKGVSIHYLDEGIDTGDIIVQRELAFSADDTLRTSFDKLHVAIETLFREHWPHIRAGTCARTPQQEPGSFHRATDKNRLIHLLTDGWDTPIARLATQVSRNVRGS
jgi:methionyl-tRNA formyltransferase